MLTTETLVDLKQYFDEQLQLTLNSIGEGDSERLVKNKVNGFIIALQDKLIEIKPKLMCSGCGMVKNEEAIQGYKIQTAEHTERVKKIANIQEDPDEKMYEVE